MRLVRCKSELIEAAHDMRFLLSRGYTRKVSLRVVSNRYGLPRNDQMVLYRGVYDNETAELHSRKMVTQEAIKAMELRVDWYNVFITVEGGIRGETLVMGDDGFLRDTRGLHGKHWETDASLEALKKIFLFLKDLGVKIVNFYLDEMVSKSGEMRVFLEETMGRHGLHGEAVTTKTPDREVICGEISASSDSIIIERASAVFDIPSNLFFEDENIVAAVLM
ncbi:MAG: DUF434 domain-containing protein [Nitrososphaeria archaeon]|nr:DUF434 domain-containing protein [Nitrososphaeria archaeon]NIQ33447.1 DUF434 domain-containing protein [Nitrososphaeria archaeon]